MINKLKKQVKNTQKLSKAFEALDTSKKKEPDEYWKPKMGKDNVGEAIVRFLPSVDGEDIPFVRVFWHSFQNPKNKKWYIEKCRTTLDGSRKPGIDPVNDYNVQNWEKGEEAQTFIRKYTKRQTRFYANVLVLKDDINPENVGTVQVYQFGKKIYEKINEALNPTHDDEPVNVFDPWKGANFKIRIKKKDGWTNYDDSVFAKPSKISDEDKYIEEIWKQCKPLQPLLDPKTFKSFKDLETKFLDVMGHNKPKAVEIPETEDYESSKTKETLENINTSKASEPPTAAEESEETVESFFENLQTAKG